MLSLLVPSVMRSSEDQIYKFGTISVTISHKATQKGKFAKGGKFIGELVTVWGKRTALENVTRKDNLS